MTDVVALRAIAQELVDAGVTDVIACPGSRSTPLALAIRSHPGLRVRVLLDERAAGFFALGLARASRRPVAVVVTSGTAVAELLPAVVEASLARVPLVLLTADRPPELRDRGAPQTIDQAGIFGRQVRWSVDLPLLDGADETRRHVRSVVGRAVATARGGPAGPVHVNVGFREPLIPSDGLGPLAGADDATVGPVTVGRRRASAPRRCGGPGSGGSRRRDRTRTDRRGTAGRSGTAGGHSPGSRPRRASRSSPTRCRARAAGRMTAHSF